MKYIVSGIVPQPMHRARFTQFDHHRSTEHADQATNYPVGEADRRIEVVCRNKYTAEVMEAIYSRLFRKVERHVYRP